MITPDYTATMATYNRWQNTNLVNSANQLSEADRNKDMGGFFGSISQTCNHIVWGDTLWLSRFDDTPPPRKEMIGESIDECDGWEEFCQRRVELDAAISKWANSVSQAYLDSEMTCNLRVAKRIVTKPVGFFVTHFFNHQTHHRGQVHAMLTRLGASTEDTDMPLLPD